MATADSGSNRPVHGGGDFTFRAVVFGVILSLVMAAANVYLGLKGGMTISANIPCSVLAIIVIGTLFKSKSISEVNVSQATGSVGEGLAAGLIFIFPAFVMTGAFPAYSEWGMKEWVTVTMAVMSGCILGMVFAGFVRKPMIEDSKELRYPEGVATAEILKTGMAALSENKKDGVLGLAAAALGGMLVKVFSSGAALMEETVSATFRIGGGVFRVGSDVSAALFGVGFILEFNGAMLVFSGSALAWLVFIPIYTAIQGSSGVAAEIAMQAWKEQIRFIGVGGMLVGGIWSIVQMRKQLSDGIKTALKGVASSGKTKDPDLSGKTVWGLIIIGSLIAAGVYFFNIGARGASISTIYTVLMMFFFVAVSVYTVGLLGSSNQPVSGTTICTFLLGSLFLYIGGIGGAEAVKAVLLIAGVIALAICTSGTAAQNFKTASLVGGGARSLQAGLIIASVITSFISVPLLLFINKAYVIGSERLPAPQAGMFSSMAKGLFETGASIPWNMVAYGLALGIVLVAIGELLRRSGSKFGVSPMAVSIGVYLPFTTTLPILLGGVVHHLLTSSEKDPGRLSAKIQTGTVLCAGLVAGEAITAVILAIPVVLGAELPLAMVNSHAARSVISLAVLAVMPVLLFRAVKGKINQ